jgi:hypothetical protein
MTAPVHTIDTNPPTAMVDDVKPPPCEQFHAEAAQRRAEVDALRAAADHAQDEFRRWAIQAWRSGDTGCTGADVAAMLGVARQRLYQLEQLLVVD